MRSLINWKVLLGLSIALTIVFFSSVLFDLTRSRNQAQVMINDIKGAAQGIQKSNDRLKVLLDSITKESAHLERRIAFLEAQKDSLSKGISRLPRSVKGKSGISDLAGNYYMNCGNMVQIDIPGKYANKKIKYSSDDARILETTIPGQIIMFPLQSSVRIAVESGGTVIKRVEYPIIKNVPQPEVQIYQGTQKIDLKRGAIGKTLSTLRVVIEPDPDFRKAAPKDARYLTKKWELNVTRGASVILRRVCTSESVDLTAQRSLFKPGDVIHISAMVFVRLTFYDKQDMVTTPEVILKFPIL
ncbi:MAG TPA: hypothetical protein VEW65_10190 [Chryseolinea sp.]|nr:hypothetical protein [Chryseolinea sp.]